MPMFINIFAALLVIAGLFLIIKPSLLFQQLSDDADKIWLYISAIIVRLILGTALISIADTSRHPLAIGIIGWVALISAFLFTLIGWNKFKSLMAWVLKVSKPYARIAGFFSVGFGAFLLYAFF